MSNVDEHCSLHQYPVKKLGLENSWNIKMTYWCSKTRSSVIEQLLHVHPVQGHVLKTYTVQNGIKDPNSLCFTVPLAWGGGE